MKKLIVMIALGAITVPAAALAQGGGQGMRDQTRAEAQQRADMMFQMLDANRDGTVTKAEADQAFAQAQAARGGETSRGGRTRALIEQAFATNPSLTLQQFEAQVLARFDAADLNHDGIVSAAERAQARAQQGAAAPAAAATPAPTPTKPQ